MAHGHYNLLIAISIECYARYDTKISYKARQNFMNRITMNEHGNYEIPRELHNELESSLNTIGNLAEIAIGFCENNLEYEKICPILTTLEYLKLEYDKIYDKF